MNTTTIHISELVTRLEQAFADGPTREGITNLLRDNPVEPASLNPYIRFSKHKYTRNLVSRNERFEVLVLCWSSGQISAIHNHCDQDCWMAAPMGKLLVQNYRVVEGDERGGHCELEPTTQEWMSPSEPCFVDPDEPIHSVANPEELDQETVSIHVYADPYDHCMVYSLGANQARQVDLVYDSKPA